MASLLIAHLLRDHWAFLVWIAVALGGWIGAGVIVVLFLRMHDSGD